MADVVRDNYQYFDINEWAMSNCRTVGCIAGLAVVHFAEDEWDTYEAGLKALATKPGESKRSLFTQTHYASGSVIRERARELIELTETQAGNVFFPDNWPDEFENGINRAKTQKAAARFAAKYLTAIADGKVDLNIA